MKNGARIECYESVVGQDAEYSLLYAKNVCKGPFVAGEKSIVNHPFIAYRYCKEVINRRWYAAEEAIKKDCRSSCGYAKDLIKGRWHEAEKIIAKAPDWATVYAEDVLKSRFVDAEAAIARNDNAALNYYHFVIKGDWRGWSDKQIMRSDVWMYQFAKSLGCMLPKELHEQMILRNPKREYVARYTEEFCR